MQTVFKGNIWVHDPRIQDWYMVDCTNICLTHERAQELLNDLKKTDWWRFRFQNHPDKMDGYLVDYNVSSPTLENL